LFVSGSLKLRLRLFLGEKGEDLLFVDKKNKNEILNNIKHEKRKKDIKEFSV